MALKGSFKSYPISNKEFGLFCEWSGVQNITENYTDLTLKVYLRHWNLLFVGARPNQQVVIDGVKKIYTSPHLNFESNNGLVYTHFTTQTVRVPHLPDGTKSVAIRVTWDGQLNYTGAYVHSITASSTLSLDKIDRTGSRLNLSVDNIDSHYVEISATSKENCDQWDYSVNGGNSWTRFHSGASSKTSYRIGNLTPNKSYSLVVRARKTSNSVVGQSNTQEVTTLGASVLNFVNPLELDDENVKVRFSVTAYEPQLKHTLEIKHHERVLKSISNLMFAVGSNLNGLFLTQEERQRLIDEMLSLEDSVVVTLTTYKNNTKFGEVSTVSVPIRLDPVKSAPELVDFDYTDMNTRATTVTENSKLLINGISSLQVILNNHLTKYGARVRAYQALFNGEAKGNLVNNKILFDNVNSDGVFKVSANIVDARGTTSNTLVKEVTVLPYEKPSVTAWKARRVNDYENAIELSFEGNYSVLEIEKQEKNYMTAFEYCYKKRTDSNYSNWVSIPSVSTTSGKFSRVMSRLTSLDAEFAFDIKVRVKDRLSEGEVSLVVPRGIPLMSFRSKRVGINKAQPETTLDVGGDIKSEGLSVIGQTTLLGTITMGGQTNLLSGATVGGNVLFGGEVTCNGGINLGNTVTFKNKKLVLPDTSLNNVKVLTSRSDLPSWSSYGRTIQIGDKVGDTYFICVDSNGVLSTGVKTRGANSITWKKIGG